MQLTYECGRARAFISDPLDPTNATQVQQNFTCDWDSGWIDQNGLRSCYCECQEEQDNDS